MKRQQLHRNVIGHVEHEDLNHVGQAHQRTERCGPGKDQKNAAQEFGAPGENLVRRRSPYGWSVAFKWNGFVPGRSSVLCSTAFFISLASVVSH
jgi:hypothetical protein